MPLKRKKHNHSDIKVDINGKNIPLRIYSEYRSNVRVSLGKDFVILRIPLFFVGSKDKHIDFAKQWLESLDKSKPMALHKYNAQKYEESFRFTILGTYSFDVEVVEEDRSNGVAEMINGTLIRITIPEEDNAVHKKKMIRTLISRIVARKFKRAVEDRVKYWNDHFFGKTINKVFLKYNATNWGSCSVDHNINLSTRSLLLPIEVFDYIIVHELSHLVEMNHSDRFWKVVEKVMPEYETHEAWLKKNGSKLDF